MDSDLKNAQRIVAVTEVLIPHIDEILVRGADGTVDITLFISDDALDLLLDSRPEGIVSNLNSGDTIYRGIKISCYSLFLIDNEILYTGIYSDTNHLSAVIRNTDPGAIQWAKESVSELEEEGKVLTAQDVGQY